MSDIDIGESLDVSKEEHDLGVITAAFCNWGRTTIVKLQTTDHYEAVGTYTVGPTNSPPQIRVAIARTNAARRLQLARNRKKLT